MDPAISLRHLNHSFGTGPLRKQILFDISADINPGEIVINTGPSGSGKTTMLTLVCGLRTVQDGSVKTLGVELNGATRDSVVGVRRNIGFIFQAHNLLGALTARENVEMGLLDERLSRDETRGRAEEMLRAVGLEQRVNHLPRELSGGQKQRVAIARALVRRPKIVLADEPTAALDKASGREVVDLLHTLAKQQGCAILLVTHDNRILDIADRILTLEDGRISSFAAGVRANTEQLLTELGRMNRSGDLRRHLRELPVSEFLTVLDGMTTEFEELLRTLDVANAGATSALLDQVLDVAADRVRDTLAAERTTVFLVDERRGELWSKVAHHDGDRPLDIRLPIGEGIAGTVAQTGAIMNIADPYAHPNFNQDVDRRSGFRTRSILATAVRGRGGEIVGVVQVLNKRGAPAFTPADEQSLQELAQPLGIILETCERIVRQGSSATA